MLTPADAAEFARDNGSKLPRFLAKRSRTKTFPTLSSRGRSSFSSPTKLLVSCIAVLVWGDIDCQFQFFEQAQPPEDSEIEPGEKSALPDEKRPAQDPPHWDEAAFAPLSDAAAELGESPVWSSADQAVWWVDISGKRLLRTDLDGRTTATGTPEMPGFVQVVEGVVFVGMQSGIFRFHESDATFERVAAITSKTQRFNDACSDVRGRIWAGTMDMDNARDDGDLYLFDPGNLSLRIMATGFRTINGLAWDEAGSRLFVSDSHPLIQTVWTRDVAADGTLAPPALFADFSLLDGRPDGAALAENGDYWIAGVGGSSLYRFAQDGTLTQRFRVPTPSPTKVAILPGPEPAMVMTSIGGQDETTSGRLALWNSLPNDLHHQDTPVAP